MTRRIVLGVVGLLALALPGLSTGASATSLAAPQEPRALTAQAEASDPTIAAAGDIACGSTDSSYNAGNGTATACRMRYTSDLLVNGGYAGVLTLGDNMQSDPSPTGFATVFDSTWGRVKPLIHPEAGNHDYGYSGAKGYYGYFGAAAGDPTRGYYSFDIGAWHVVALNSNCSKIAGGCTSGGAQDLWLRADLAAHPGQCTLAFDHHPRYSSGHEGDSSFMTALYQDLLDAGADVLLSGHSHDYERFGPQNNASQLDLDRGITQFVVGTGGSFFTGLGTRHANSVVSQNSTFGVLGLTLHQSSYDWRFQPEAGKTWTDSGSRACHASTLPANDFSMSATPSALSVDAGQAGSSTISTAVISGTAQALTLSASGAPAGATVSFSPQSVVAGGSSTMTVSTSSTTPAGTSSLVVTGTGASVTRTTPVTLTVVRPVANDFSVSASPSSLTVTAGQAATSTISTTVVSGETQSVSLSASGLPAGASMTFSPQTVATGGSSTMTVTTSSTTPAGISTLIVTGTGASVTRTTPVTLTVVRPVADDFSMSASPSSLSLTAGQEASSTISTTVVSGATQSVSLSASGVPAGASVTFSPQTVAAGGSSTMTVTTTTASNTGTSTLVVTGTGASASRQTSVTLTVTSGTSSTPRLEQSSGATETSAATSLTTVLPTPTKSGGLLVLTAGVYTGTTNRITSVTDSAGNTWVRAGAYASAGHYSDGELWYAANAKPTTSVLARTASAAVMATTLMEFSGVATSSPLDLSAGASNTGTSAASGPVTPTASNELVVGFAAGHGSTQPMVVNSAGFTPLPQRTSAASTVTSVVTAYRLTTAGTPVSMTATFGKAMYWAAGIFVFRPASGT